jgi:Uma2 family endonuclease
MSAAHPVFHSLRDYFAFEEHSPDKHEYLAGQIYAMAGGTPDHAALAAAVTIELGVLLRGRSCRVLGSDLRIGVRESTLVTYPDVSVVCGPRELHPENENTVTNPILLVEVTSKSTEEYDRGEKFEHYAKIPSLKEYVLVSHREGEIEVRRRETDGSWTSHVAHAGERAELTSVGGTLDVDAISAAATEPAA